MKSLKESLLRSVNETTSFNNNFYDKTLGIECYNDVLKFYLDGNTKAHSDSEELSIRPISDGIIFRMDDLDIYYTLSYKEVKELQIAIIEHKSWYTKNKDFGYFISKYYAKDEIFIQFKDHTAKGKIPCMFMISPEQNNFLLTWLTENM